MIPICIHVVATSLAASFLAPFMAVVRSNWSGIHLSLMGIRGIMPNTKRAGTSPDGPAASLTALVASASAISFGSLGELADTLLKTLWIKSWSFSPMLIAL